MAQRLKAVTYTGELETVPTRSRGLAEKGYKITRGTHLRIDIHCPIATCAGAFDGTVTFVVPALPSEEREMPDPAPCNECGVMVCLNEGILRHAQPDYKVVAPAR